MTPVPAPTTQPLFHRTYREIADRIARGEFAPGDRLPSERWFGGALGVSRSTVRRAMDELVDSGLAEADRNGLLVTAQAGAGSDRLVSLTELAAARGLTVTARVRAARVRPATLDEAETFRVAPGTELFELDRVRLLDGLEVCIDHDRLPAALLPHSAEIDFTTASLYGVLEEAGNEIAEVRTQIEAAAASEVEARLLDLEPGAPVLVANEETSDRRGRVLTLGRTVYRSDRHRFLATFVGTPRRAARTE